MAKQADKSKEKTVSGAKNTVPEAQETPAEVVTDAVPEVADTPPGDNETAPETDPDAAPETPPEVPETPKRYVFPRSGDVKCPGCGLYETIATSTQGAVQFRRCTRAIPLCGRTFKITGQEVKFTDCKQES